MKVPMFRMNPDGYQVQVDGVLALQPALNGLFVGTCFCSSTSNGTLLLPCIRGVKTSRQAFALKKRALRVCISWFSWMHARIS